MRTSGHRPRLVPRTAIIATVVVLLLVAGAVIAEVYVYRSGLVTVPDVTGMSVGAATSAVEASRLTVVVSGVRVSGDVPEDSVLSQSPDAGSMLPTGSVVALVLSAGAQTVRLPDLVGLPVAEARETLAGLGLLVREVPSSMESTATTVLEMFPAPGSLLSTGDTVRLTVPGLTQGSEVLLPYDLAGIGVLIDPTGAAGSGQSDPTLQIARRLLSLLEASGAEVSLTRTSSTDAPTSSARGLVSSESTATVFVGIDTDPARPGGITIGYAVTGDAPRDARSQSFARAITGAMRLPGVSVNAPVVSDDAVARAFPGAGVRVSVGSFSDPSDAARFADPEWADGVARSLYRGLGQVLVGAPATDGVD